MKVHITVIDKVNEVVFDTREDNIPEIKNVKDLWHHYASEPYAPARCNGKLFRYPGGLVDYDCGGVGEHVGYEWEQLGMVNSIVLET